MNTTGKDAGAKSKYKKPNRPCLFCSREQTQLKRHILKKHSKHPKVIPLLDENITKEEQNHAIETFRKEAIRKFNIEVIKSGKTNFMRERENNNSSDPPVMCSGCKGFFEKRYKARHQTICPGKGTNIMVPMVSVEECLNFDEYSDGFKSLLSTLHQDDVGITLKQIVLYSWLENDRTLH